MTRTQRFLFEFLFWCSVLGMVSDSFRDIVFPDGTRTTDCCILLVIALFTEWIMKAIDER